MQSLLEQPVRQQIGTHEYPPRTGFAQFGDHVGNPGRPGGDVADAHRPAQFRGQHGGSTPHIVARTNVGGARGRQHHRVARAHTRCAQPQAHHPGQLRIRAHRRGHDHIAAAAVTDLPRHILIDVISGGQKGRNHHGRTTVQLPQHRGGRGAEDVDEGGVHRCAGRTGAVQLRPHRGRERTDHVHPLRAAGAVGGQHQRGGAHHTSTIDAGRGGWEDESYPAAGRGASTQSAGSNASR